MGKTVTFNCARCGKEKTASFYRAKALQGRPRYCSTDCCHRVWPPAIERFWANVEKRADGCWHWIGKSKNNWGYPKFYENKKAIMGHKWAYKHFVGPIPEGKLLMHSCDNPSCVNPEHLRPGTLSENSQDMLRKGRSFWQKKRTQQVTQDE